MSDPHSKEIRSYNMSMIRSKNTRPEMIVRKYLHKNGYRYKLHDLSLPGKPDLVLVKYKTAIFVNGCFWHGHNGCRYYVIPKTRTEWWQAKLLKNKENDAQNFEELKSGSWKVICIWECELKNDIAPKTLGSLLKQISNR
jgi:DNA mismatch endonuclease (patch repair protein)